MRQYIGTDIIEIARIEKAIARWGERFLERLYTETELKLYRRRLPSLSARFAGKEAVIKALSPQIGACRWQDIEILSEASGKPYLNLYGKTRDRAKSLGLKQLEISLAHSRHYALAVVIGTAK